MLPSCVTRAIIGGTYLAIYVVEGCPNLASGPLGPTFVAAVCVQRPHTPAASPFFGLVFMNYMLLIGELGLPSSCYLFSPVPGAAPPPPPLSLM